MDFERLNSIVARTFFFGAFLLFAMAVVFKLLVMLGLAPYDYSFNPARVLEWAVILLVFVIASLLRQIREEMKKGGG